MEKETDDFSKVMNSTLVEHFKEQVETILDTTIETFRIVIDKNEIKALDIESISLQIQIKKFSEFISGKDKQIKTGIDMEIENNKNMLLDSFAQDLIELLANTMKLLRVQDY